MMDQFEAPKDAAPAKSATITVAGSRYEFVKVEHMTWPELRVLKRLSGMSPLDAERAIMGVDPDAWYAFLFVAISRVAPQLTEAKLDEMLAKSPPLVEIMGSMERSPGVDVPVPPSVPASTPDERTGPLSTSSGDETPQLSDLERSGHPG